MENRKEPWVLDEVEKSVSLDLPGKEPIATWVKKFGPNAMWLNLNYTLGPLFLNYGSFLRKNLGKVEKIDITSIEVTMIPFIAWITKVILGEKVKITINKEGVGTLERFNLGNFYRYIDIKILTEDIDSLSVRELRELTEIFATSHSLIADALYQLDFGTTLGDTPNAEIIEIKGKREAVVNKVSSWQAYGRYSLRKIRKTIIDNFKKENEVCLLIPCTMGKPYYGNLSNINPDSHDSQTEIKREIATGGRDVVVMTTIGVVPQSYWYDPVDIGYDVRVPSLWDDFLSMKEFFKKNKYEKVISYLNYPPYIEMLEILLKLGVIKEIEWKKQMDLTKKGNFGAFFAIAQESKGE